MSTDELKYVVGDAKSDAPIVMRFYGAITCDSVQDFNNEFLWIQDYVKPSKIVVNINSEGGSVIQGMSTFSIIQQCPIEVVTVIDGIAASMASVIWAAGDKSYMRDYSILMIHNPFMAHVNQEELTPDMQQTVEAFKKQIEMVYHKRFGLSKSRVREIMEGKDGCDGTYFDAKAAVEAGILPAEHIIKTSKQVREEVKNQIEGIEEAVDIQKIMASINAELGDFKPQVEFGSITNQTEISKSQTKMEKEQEFAFSSVCAQLGLDKTAEVSAAINRINVLMEAENKVKEIQASLDEMKIQKAGVDAELTNVKDELSAVQNELKAYQDAEKAQRDAAIEQFVDAAVKDGKIDEAAKANWIEMAQTNFEMVQATLNSIMPRVKISEEIAADAANVDDAANGLSEADKKMAAAVEAAVGKDFQFQSLD